MKSRVLWITLTALLILTGAVLPYVTVGLQDTYAEDRTELRPFDTVELSLRQELEAGQVLRLLSGSTGSDGWVNGQRGSTTWIDWQSDTRLTREGVEKTAAALLAEMAEEDMMRRPPEGWTLRFFGMDPNLVVSDSIRDLSAVVWIVSWVLEPPEDGEKNAAYMDESISGSMYIDDATGQMVGMVLPVSNYWKKLSLQERAVLTADFLERYYGMDIRELEPIYPSEQAVGLEDEFGDHVLRFDMGELGQCDVELMQDREWLYFNC